MKKILMIAIGILGLMTGIHAQIEPELKTRIDSLFEKWNTKDSPGFSIGIIKDGQMLYDQSYGMSNLDYGIPLSSDARFYIASTSKQFTAACIALLVLEGKVKLEDDIRKYIPEVPDYGQKISIRHLIHHTSGLRDYLGLMYLSDKSFEDYFSIEDAIEALGRQRSLNFLPGERHLYSNSGYVLMAEIVNRASGMSIREYADKHIFQALGMQHTFFNDDHHQITPKKVISYEYEGKDKIKRFIQNFDALGDGNLLTTVNDMYLWDQNFYHGKVGGEAFRNLMLSRGVLNSGDSLEYAFGLVLDEYKGHRRISHGGGMLGFRTQYVRFPDYNLSVVVFSNLASADPTEKALAIADFFLPPASGDLQDEGKEESKKASDRSPISEVKMEQYTGIYDLYPGIELNITIDKNRLKILQSWDQNQEFLLPLEEGKFILENDPKVEVIFKDLEDTKTNTLQVDNRGDEVIFLRKVDLNVDQIDLGKFEGKYYSEELDTHYTISQKERVLLLKIGGRPPLKLPPFRLNTFANTQEGMILKFKEQMDKVSGFTLDVGRVKNLYFSKV